MRRNAIIGGLLWIAIATATRFHWARLTLIDLLFLIGPLVVVPLGLELCAGFAQNEGTLFPVRSARWFQPAAALCFIASLRFEPGIAAGIFTLPWTGFGCFLGFSALLRFFRGGFRTLRSACTLTSFLYLSVGCAWLIASRLGLTPMGFQEPIVLLTAVHFHFAGFAAPLMALSVGTAVGKKNAAQQRLFKAVTAGVLAGPGLLAAGFVIGPHFKLAAALVVACSEMGLSLFFLTNLRALRPRLAQIFIAISAASVLLAMALAAVWAIGEFPLQPFVHLDQMARVHGTANAFGFVLCGLIGWTLAASQTPGLKAGTK
jgi:hypothetical protein